MLHDVIIESSDQPPAQLHFHHLFSILHTNGVTTESALKKQQEAQKCTLNFTCFLPSMLQEWQARFQSAHVTEIARSKPIIRGAPLHDHHLMTTTATSIDAVISHAVQLAQACSPKHASTQQPSHIRTRRKWTFRRQPKAMACQHQ